MISGLDLFKSSICSATVRLMVPSNMQAFSDYKAMCVHYRKVRKHREHKCLLSPLTPPRRDNHCSIHVCVNHDRPFVLHLLGLLTPEKYTKKIWLIIPSRKYHELMLCGRKTNFPSYPFSFFWLD